MIRTHSGTYRGRNVECLMRNGQIVRGRFVDGKSKVYVLEGPSGKRFTVQRKEVKVLRAFIHHGASK